MKTLFIVIIALFMVGCSDESKSKDKPQENSGLSQGTQPADSNNTQLDTDNGSEPNENRPPNINTPDTNITDKPKEDLPKDPDDIKQPVAPKIKNEKLRPPSIPTL